MEKKQETQEGLRANQEIRCIDLTDDDDDDEDESLIFISPHGLDIASAPF